MVGATSRKKTGTTIARIVNWPFIGLANRHFVPLAVFFFPIVERFAVDLVHRRLSDFHFTGLSGQKEIDVVSLTVRSFHVHAREVLPVAEILQPIIVHFYQVERQILSFICHMKFPIAALFALSIDVFLNASRNISSADLFFRGALLWMLRGFLRMFWMLLGTD